MTREENLRNLAQPPSDTERTKCENAERTIKAAIDSDATLSKMGLRVFAQGSYKANTNIKLDSDVDICVLYDGQFFGDYPQGYTAGDFGFTDGSIPFQKYKDMIESALVNRFGRSGVARGNKAFDVHANTYRVDADVVPAFVYKRFTAAPNFYNGHSKIDGIAFIPDNGGKIINWPDQTYQNGVNKNTVTGRKYKSVIRILKRLRNKMQDERIVAANNIASFLIESLVWNVPNSFFEKEDYEEILKDSLLHLYSSTKTGDKCSEWGEVNELKYLFRPNQPWTREQANGFIVATWSYLGF